MGLYTVLKPCLNGENINITKNDIKFFFFPKILISFKKLKNFSGEISLNNMRSDLVVKWLSLISIKSEPVSKICSMVKRLSHPTHIGAVSRVKNTYDLHNECIAVPAMIDLLLV